MVLADFLTVLVRTPWKITSTEEEYDNRVRYMTMEYKDLLPRERIALLHMMILMQIVVARWSNIQRGVSLVVRGRNRSEYTINSRHHEYLV